MRYRGRFGSGGRRFEERIGQLSHTQRNLQRKSVAERFVEQLVQLIVRVFGHQKDQVFLLPGPIVLV